MDTSANLLTQAQQRSRIFSGYRGALLGYFAGSMRREQVTRKADMRHRVARNGNRRREGRRRPLETECDGTTWRENSDGGRLEHSARQRSDGNAAPAVFKWTDAHEEAWDDPGRCGRPWMGKCAAAFVYASQQPVSDTMRCGNTAEEREGGGGGGV